MARNNDNRGRHGRRRREKSEFDHQLVDLARVARVVAGGRRFRFRATVVIGDRKGRVGYGMAKGKDVSNSVEKATEIAKKNLVTIPLVNDTVPHEMAVKHSGAHILIKPARPGTGIIAGGAVRPVMELAGVKNVISKMFGSANKANNVKAVIKALSTMKLPEDLSKVRGVEVKGTFQKKAESVKEKKAEKKVVEKDKAGA